MEEARKNEAGIYHRKPAVVNLGIQMFYRALEDQDCKCPQIQWMPEYQQSEEIESLLDEFL